MAPTALQHRRTHNLLLISKLLNPREASPFTLLLDSLEQSARPLLKEFIRRAKANKVRVILVSFETLRRPHDVDFLVEAWRSVGDGLKAREWETEVAKVLKTDSGRRTLLIFDSLNTLIDSPSTPLTSLLSSLISPATSLLAVYHTDIPIPSPPNPYDPTPLTLLKFLATTLITLHSVSQTIARRSSRHVAAPNFGLDQGLEGVVQGKGANGVDGVVLEAEHRRRSGRWMREWYYLPLPSSTPKEGNGDVILLEDHPFFRRADAEDKVEEEVETTFELGLTEKQRKDREGVVLPYFDAQGGGAGQGGRILYDMGREDDFDEEEDEI